MTFKKLLEDSFIVLMSQAKVGKMLNAKSNVFNLSLGLDANTEQNIPHVDNKTYADLTDNVQ